MAHKNWQNVKDTFHEALRRDSAERDGFLDEACKGDIDFRIEVESLLISLTEAKSFLEQPVIGEIPKPKSAWKLEKGQVFSHYRIVSPIASGGMGEVYLAEDEQLRRNVALKVLPEDLLENQERLRRFQREAQVVSGLNHPNILTIFEFGNVDDVHFMASEFVKGETLRTLLENGRLPIQDTLEIATQIASALKAAHEAGVVHRDIKPENVMIRDDGYVKVLDFGLAKLAAQPTENLETATQKILSKPGVIMGTVTYMSPEQARARHIDARSDLFSFGVVLFEMLTGRVPFAGETMTDVIAEIIQGTPRRVSSYNSSVPDDMDRIVAKCLEKDRDERYQTAADLLADLKRLSRRSDTIDEAAATPTKPNDGHPTVILEPRPTESSIFATQAPRRPVFLMAAAAAIVVAALALGYWYYNSQNANQIESIAVMPFVNGSGNADIEYLSDGMTETLISSLSQLPNLNVKASSSVFRYKGKETDARTIGNELNVQAILNGRVIQRGTELTLYVELVDSATENSLWKQTYNKTMTNLVALQSDIARDVADGLKVKLSGADEQKLAKTYTQNPEAYLLYLQGRFYWNKRNMEKSREYFQQAISLDPTYALAYAGLADTYGIFGVFSFPDPAVAMDNRVRGREAALKAVSLDENLAEARTTLGTVLTTYNYDFVGAEREYRRAIGLNPKYADAHYFLAQHLGRLGKWAEAESEYERALEIEPLNLVYQANYGSMFAYSRRSDEAIVRLEKTLQLDENFGPTIGNLSIASWIKGDYARSVKMSARARELTGDNHDAAMIRDSFAKGGWEGYLRHMTSDNRPVGASLYFVGLCYTALGEKDKAFAALNQSYENRESILQRLKVDPRLDPLRDDPRFAELLRKVGFPE